MPDWREIVRARLGNLDLEPAREVEVAAELAAHFEDLEEHALRCGVPATVGEILEDREVPDWSALRRNIRRAIRKEEEMKERIRCLWLPGLATSVLALGALSSAWRAGLRPAFVGTTPPMPLYLPWLVGLPIVGAMGALWSRRAGGRVVQRLLAASFPAAVILALYLGGILLSFFVDELTFGTPRVPLTVKLGALLIYTLGWVVLPAAALLLGALPFLGGRSNSKASQRAIA